jgi:hypothetical protein
VTSATADHVAKLINTHIHKTSFTQQLSETLASFLLGKGGRRNFCQFDHVLQRAGMLVDYVLHGFLHRGGQQQFFCLLEIFRLRFDGSR